MKMLPLLLAAGCLALPAPAEELNWAELVRRPELWPAQCAPRQTMRFEGGVTITAGQKLNILGFKPNEVEVSTTDGRTTFAAEPDETDALEVARAAYAALTPKQRALTYPALFQQRDLWPARVALTRTFDLGGGQALHQGDQLVVKGVDGGALFLLAEKISTTFHVVPQATDFMAQARIFVENPQAGPRLVAVEQAAGEKQKLAEAQQRLVEAKAKEEGRVIAELEGKLVNSVTGRPEPLDAAALPRYIVFYRGSSTCPYTRAFTPDLIKYYREMKPKHPEFEVVYIMTESVADTGRFAKGMGFSWRAVEYESTASMPTASRAIGSLLPQLLVLDRTGRVLVNGMQTGAPAALKQLDALLRRPSPPD